MVLPLTNGISDWNILSAPTAWIDWKDPRSALDQMLLYLPRPMIPTHVMISLMGRNLQHQSQVRVY